MTPRAASVPDPARGASGRSRWRPRVAAIFAALFASACAGALRPAPPEIAARARAAQTYSARLRVSLRGPEFRARARILLGFRRPDALRLEVPGPSGAQLIAVARGGSLLAVFPAERAVFAGAATEADLKALLGVA